MRKQVQLLHSVHKSKLDEILKNGLKSVSRFEDLGLEMRTGVVYCWFRKEDDKVWGSQDDHVYVEVMVEQARCRVAEMDFVSLAMMYHQGSGGRPKNEEAARLLAEVYRVTSVPLSEYTDRMFSSPEILVKGDIVPENIRLASGH